MKESDLKFWLSHQVAYAAKALKVPETALYDLASYASTMGGFSIIESLKKVSDRKNAYPVKRLVETLDLKNDEDYSEEVDEGGQNHHDNFPLFVENPTNEPAKVNEYSLLSVPESYVP